MSKLAMIARERHVQSVGGAGLTLALLSVVRPMPWVLWAAWGAGVCVSAYLVIRDFARHDAQDAKRIPKGP